MNHSYTVCRRKMFFTAFILPVFILLSAIVKGQSLEGFPEFGTFTPQEAALKQVDFDKDASAVVIHDLAKSEYNDEWNLITLHRVKIKILNEKGVDNANISIRYYSKGDFEYLTDIGAVIRTYESNGQFTNETLNRKNIFDKKIDGYYSETRFTLPNVKAGSIIEYTYVSHMKNYNGLDDWSFQTDLPTISSFYTLAILPNAEFTYKVYKLSSLPLEINPKTEGWISFKMQNIPALHNEAYMDSRRDNLQRVTFQLSSFNRTGAKQKYITSWDDAAKELLAEPALGGQLHRSLSGTDDFIKSTKAIPDVSERLKATYEFVQQRMSSNGYSSKYSADGIKKAWEKGMGTSGEINLILVNLLSDVDVPAYPMITNERFRGKIDISYPFIDQFSNTVAYIKLPGKALVVDASDEDTPMNMVPYNLLNTYGYIIDKKEKGLVIIQDDKLYDDNRINIVGVINSEGTLEGSVTTQSRDYARLERKADYNKEGAAKFLEKYFSEGYTNLDADSLVISNLDADSLPFTQNLKFTQTLNTSGDYTFLNYHLFTGLTRNPFTNDLRFSDINFGSPQRYAVTQLIQIPDNYVVDALPKNVTMITPDTAFALSRIIKFESGLLNSQFKLTINRSFFERNDYQGLQSFYKQMFALLNEQVVLKPKQ
jgi:hypothetical protein